MTAAVQKVLFVCSQNQLRSPTAEQVFASWPGIEVASAGTDRTAAVPVSPELLQWASVIFVMERTHLNRIRTRFGAYLRHQRVICLNIPDEFEYMDPRLIQLLRAVVPRYL